MSMEPETRPGEVPPCEDLKTTLIWTGGAIALVAVIAAFMI